MHSQCIRTWYERAARLCMPEKGLRLLNACLSDRMFALLLGGGFSSMGERGLLGLLSYPCVQIVCVVRV